MGERHEVYSKKAIRRLAEGHVQSAGPSKHIKRLTRRLAFLEQRIAEGQAYTGVDYDRSEAAALRWALSVIPKPTTPDTGDTDEP